MSDKDRIYELFRRNEHKLDEKPSRRAWERLDARLDRHDARRVTPGWFKYGGMVAAVLILVVTATMLTLNTQMENDQFAELEKSNVATSPLLDFETEGNNDSYLKIVAYQKEYKNRSNRITEETIAGNLRPRGTKRKKAAPKMDAERIPTDADQAIAANDVVRDEAKDKMFYEDADDIAIENRIIEEPVVVESEVKKEMESLEMADEVEIEELIADADLSEKVKATAPLAPAMPTPTAAPPSAAGNADYEAGIKAKAEVRSAKSESKAMTDESPSYDMNVEDDLIGMDDKEDLSLSSFEWMLGSWKGNVNGSESTEKWTKIDASTYRGKGTLKAGGTTLFSEKIDLKKTSGGTYLTVSLDKKNKRVAYRMTSNEGGVIVFENRSVTYPQKIVVKKNSNNSFSMTMQNGDTGSLDNKQIQYLENRNSIVGEKLIRSLKKAE